MSVDLGTRLHVYRWLDNLHARETSNADQLESLPVIETKKKWAKKTKPGISTFGEKPTRVGPDHLEELFEKARKVVPEHEAERTPLFLLATAGMRLLPKHQQDVLLTEVCAYARSKTKFSVPDCDIHIRIIPGEVEGLYGWIAANYLLGGFDHPKMHDGEHDHPTFGFLDMGGASAQIAFAPNATESERHADDLKLLRLRTVDGTPAEYRVFSTTWLRFGVNEARVRYVDGLRKGDEFRHSKELLDPCLPRGLKITPKGDVFLPDEKTVDGKTPILLGVGKFDECLKSTQPLLEKDHICEDDPCLVSGVHVPAIDFDVNHFVGVSEYWHITHEIFQVGEKDKSYDFNSYQQRVSNFCNQEWEKIEEGIKQHEWGEKVDEKTVVEVCFKASWLINVLHEGIGIPRVGVEDTPDASRNGTSKLIDSAKDKGFTPPFRPINKIEDVEVSWTLGKVVLYASSQVPPTGKDALPVGFGSNKAGVPPDFMFPSMQQGIPTSTSATNSTHMPDQPAPEDNSYRPSAILRSGRSRRIPGILLFLLILCFAIYLLLGRYRRSRHHPAVSLPKSPHMRGFRRRAFLAKKLPSLFWSSSSQGSYQRVDLEDGSGLTAPEDFELGGYVDEEGSSDSSSRSTQKGAKSSGWASPTRNRTTLPSSTGGSAGLESLGNGHGLGIGIEGSRERLGEGRRSRKASPTRSSSSRLSKLVDD
ncbi:uncharacterized protein KY384_007747 [Bacidia gigantensis]|uniref:uncharacterized protein n=1 Tax=Bacidia gigantensis TaxID=2732470 RepID=UPI001D047285|nr:uncharacterized protein KY384_007747 [Bacidia gigantensis]KAG8527594.1 hypothetical protein KY384_007747 [Bacidia gigantensis]